MKPATLNLAYILGYSGRMQRTPMPCLLAQSVTDLRDVRAFGHKTSWKFHTNLQLAFNFDIKFVYNKHKFTYAAVSVICHCSLNKLLDNAEILSLIHI